MELGCVIYVALDLDVELKWSWSLVSCLKKTTEVRHWLESPQRGLATAKLISEGHERRINKVPMLLVYCPCIYITIKAIWLS